MNFRKISFLLFLLVFCVGCSQTDNQTSIESIVTDEPTNTERITDTNYKRNKFLVDKSRAFIVTYQADDVGKIFINDKPCTLPKENLDKRVDGCLVTMFYSRKIGNDFYTYKYAIIPDTTARCQIWIENKEDIEVYRGNTCVDVIKSWDVAGHHWLYYNTKTGSWCTGNYN